MNIRPEVMRVAQAMELKLRQNDHKGLWDGCTLRYLSMRLTQEKNELIRAVMEERYQDVLNEAADVCNFAMMIADNYRPNSGIKEAVEQPLTAGNRLEDSSQITPSCDTCERFDNRTYCDDCDSGSNYK